MRPLAAPTIPPTSLLDPAVVDSPAAFYHQLLAEAPVWRVPDRDLVVVSAFEAVSEAVKRPGDFSSNIRSFVYREDDGTPGLVPFGTDLDGIDVLATADPPMHAAHRAMVLPELVARRVAELRPQVERLADQLVGGAVTTGEFDFMDAVANPIPISIVSRLIGFVDESIDDLLAAAFDSTALLAATQSLADALEAMGRAAEIVGWIAGEVDAAQDGGRTGLLDLVARAIDDGELDRANGVIMMHTLLSAGGESTTSLLGNAANLLAGSPDLQRRIRQDRELLVPFIEEVLRLESPFRYHLRYVRDETNLWDVSIPAGCTVLLLWAAANRDPRRYDEPDAIRLDRRAPRDHVGFGRGIHLCVGAALARLEAEVVLDRLLAATASFELGAEPPTREPSLMVRRFRTLRLRAMPA
jgi:cytochrome P450